MSIFYIVFFFFFQAEDGIRDYKVTGVQTCALPILEAAFLGMDGALPAEDTALVDDQRADDDVAEHFAGGEDLEAARGVHVALDRPADHDIATGDIALDPAVLADRQLPFGCQVAVHFAVEPDVG